MSEQDRDAHLLLYIRESIARIEQYVSGGHTAFFNEPMIQDAVLRRLETLTDAAGRLTDSLKARHPLIPWREIHGFRKAPP